MTTNKSDTAPPTWASIEASLSTLSAEDREALRRLTAPARHAWRVERTIAAAAAVPGHPCRAMQAALIALDLHGVGGTAGCGSGPSQTSTLRAAWARGLGKGAWQATDGRAYRAAAEEALCRLVATELEARRAAASVEVSSPPDLTTAGWIEAHGCGVLDSPWAQGCAGLPVVSASVIFAALHLFAVGIACTEGPVEDATVAQQARGYALHRMAERVARGEPVVEPEGTTWADVVRVAREFLDAATGQPGSP